jgi:hypothetical protein
MGARAFFSGDVGTGQCAPERGATGLFLNQIANGWPILLDIQHRIAVVSGIQRMLLMDCGQSLTTSRISPS